MEKAPILSVSRHRILRDGIGVTTLVGMKGCPLQCRYCINKEQLQSSYYHSITTEQLLRLVEKDDIYFRATNGGITFGGGEPLLHTEFIREFKEMCPRAWKINIETSLNVKYESVVTISSFVDRLIVDVKTLNSDIYEKYTGQRNDLLLKNLAYLSKYQMQNKVDIRIPLIPDFNDRRDIYSSVKTLKSWGFHNLRIIPYVKDKVGHNSYSQATEYGKGICNILKHIRMTIAEANGIPLKEEECPMTKCKTGTCPKCDASLSYLTNELSNKLKPIY